MKLIMELPHIDYGSKKGIDAIDFRIEKMPISTDKKHQLSNAWKDGKGIIGKMKKTNKFLLFTPMGVKVLRGEPKDKSLLLPPDWQKYAVILKDWRIDMSQKNQIREMIRKVVREILSEKAIISESNTPTIDKAIEGRIGAFNKIDNKELKNGKRFIYPRTDEKNRWVIVDKDNEVRAYVNTRHDWEVLNGGGWQKSKEPFTGKVYGG